MGVQALRSPHLFGWLSPQLLIQPLPSNPPAWPPSSFPSPSKGVATGKVLETAIAGCWDLRHVGYGHSVEQGLCSLWEIGTSS